MSADAKAALASLSLLGLTIDADGVSRPKVKPERLAVVSIDIPGEVKRELLAEIEASLQQRIGRRES